MLYNINTSTQVLESLQNTWLPLVTTFQLWFWDFEEHAHLRYYVSTTSLR